MSSHPSPIISLKLRVTQGSNMYEQVIPSSSPETTNSFPITNQTFPELLAAFNSEPEGTIFNPSIVATYAPGTFATGDVLSTPSTQANFVPRQITPTFSFDNITDRLTTSNPFYIGPLITAQGTGIVTYSSSDVTIATVNSSSSLVTIMQKAGFTYITATLAASLDNVWTAVPPITRKLTVNRATAPLTQFLDVVKNYKDPNFAPGPPTSDSNGAFTYSIAVESGDDTGVAEIVNNQVKINNAGKVTLKVTQAQTDKYTENTVKATLTVNRINPVIRSFGPFVKTFGTDTSFILPESEVLLADGDISFLITDGNSESIASLGPDGKTVTIIKAGTGDASATITARQDETRNYNNGTTSALLTVNQGTPVITVTTSSLPNKTYGDADFSLPDEAGISKTAGSTGVLAYESSDASVATINASSGLVSIVGAGEVIFTVSLPASADGNWAAASSKTVSLTVAPAPALIIRASNNVTIKYTGAAGDVPTSSPRFIEANPHGTGNEWFAVVKDGMKQKITDYAKGLSGSSTPFTPEGESSPVPFNNIVTSLMTDMSYMFRFTTFNQPLNAWDVSKVTTMSFMFDGASQFNQPLNSWNTRSVTDMSVMFRDCIAFSQNIGSWNTSNVISMGAMFAGTINFNQPLNIWDTSKVKFMDYMFYGPTAFNQPLNSWNVSAVTSMSNMFNGAAAFNQHLNSWNTAEVTDMNSMFYNATIFNQNISNWEVTQVTSFNLFRTLSALINDNTPLRFVNAGQ